MDAEDPGKVGEPIGSSYNNEIVEDGEPSARQMYAAASSGKVRQKRYTARATNPYSRPAIGRHAAAGPVAAAAVTSVTPAVIPGSRSDGRKGGPGETKTASQQGWLGGWGLGTIRNLVSWPWTALGTSGAASGGMAAGAAQASGALRAAGPAPAVHAAGAGTPGKAAEAGKKPGPGKGTPPKSQAAGPSGSLPAVDFNAILRGEREMTRDEAAFLKNWVEQKLRPGAEETPAPAMPLQDGAEVGGGSPLGSGRALDAIIRTPKAMAQRTPPSGWKTKREEFYTPPGAVEDGPSFGVDVTSPVNLAKAFMEDRLPQPPPPAVAPRALTYYPDGARAGPPEVTQNGVIEEASRQLPVQIPGTPGDGWQRALTVIPQARATGQTQAPAWTPYSRTGQWVEGVQPGVAISRWTPSRAGPLTVGREQTRKRRSSVLDDGWASVGPVRRIRPRPLIARPGGAPSQATLARAAYLAGTAPGAGEDGRQQRREDGPRRLHMVPTASAESARKILEALDRSFSPAERRQFSDEGLVKQTLSPEAMGKRAKRSMEPLEPPPRSFLEGEAGPSSGPFSSQPPPQAPGQRGQQEGFPPSTPAQYRTASKAVEQAGLQDTTTGGMGKGKELEEEPSQPRPAGGFGTTGGALGGATAGWKPAPWGSEAAGSEQRKEAGAGGPPAQAGPPPSSRGGFRMTAVFEDDILPGEEARAGKGPTTSAPPPASLFGTAALKPLGTSGSPPSLFAFAPAGTKSGASAGTPEANGGLPSGGFTFPGSTAAPEARSTPKLARAGSGPLVKGGAGASGAATPTFEFGTGTAAGQSDSATRINFASSPGAQEKQAAGKAAPKFDFQHGRGSDLCFSVGVSAKEAAAVPTGTSAAKSSHFGSGAPGTAAGTTTESTPGSTTTNIFASATGASMSRPSASPLFGSGSSAAAMPVFGKPAGTATAASVTTNDSAPAGTSTPSPLLFAPPLGGSGSAAATASSGLMSFLSNRNKAEGEAATGEGGSMTSATVFGRLGSFPSSSPTSPSTGAEAPSGVTTTTAAPLMGGFKFGTPPGAGPESGPGAGAGSGAAAGPSLSSGFPPAAGLFGSSTALGAATTPSTATPGSLFGVPAGQGEKPGTPPFGGTSSSGMGGFQFGVGVAGGSSAGKTSRPEEGEEGQRKVKRGATGGSEGGFGSAANSPPAGAALFGSSATGASGGLPGVTTSSASPGSAATSLTSVSATSAGTGSGPLLFSVPAFGQASASAPAGSSSSQAAPLFSFGAAGSSPSPSSGLAAPAAGSEFKGAVTAAPGAAASSVPSFGAGMFGSSSPAPAFGTTPASGPASAPGISASSAPNFGSAASAPFAAAGLSGPASSPAAFPGFGASSPHQASSAAAPSFAFGAASGATPGPTSASAPSAAATGFAFGAPQSPSTPAPGSGGFLFGATGAPTGAFTFGAKEGSSSPAPVFGGFGAASSTPAFGSVPSGPANQEGANGSPNAMEDSMAEEPFSPPKASPLPTIFGSSSPQPLGQAPFLFGQSPPAASLSPAGGGSFTFGAQSPAQAPANPFGAPAQPQQQPAPFGAPPAQQGIDFGGANAAQGQMLFNMGGGDKTPAGGRRLVKAKRPAGARKR